MSCLCILIVTESMAWTSMQWHMVNLKNSLTELKIESACPFHVVFSLVSLSFDNMWAVFGFIQAHHDFKERVDKKGPKYGLFHLHLPVICNNLIT